MQRELEVLRHAIGSDIYGRTRSDRNYFITGPGSTDYTTCVALVQRGLMNRTPGNAITGGGDVFRVTDTGRLFVRENSEVDPNRDWLVLAPWNEPWQYDMWFTIRATTRGKARYQAFLYLREVNDMPKSDLIRIRVKAVPRPKATADDAADDDMPF
jgi:hypothetical protein